MFRLWFAVFVVATVLATVVPSAHQAETGQRDKDTMVGQIPVKKSPTSLLTNFTLRLIDVSKNKGCKGPRCKSQGNRESYSYHMADDQMYADEEPGDDEICEQPVEVGDCDDRYIRWYFNNHDGRCHRFRYSGCGGNENNFRTRRRCESECNYYDDDDDEVGGDGHY